MATTGQPFRGRTTCKMPQLRSPCATCSALDDEQIEKGLRTYPGLPHRMERIREKDGVIFVNDSKATNPTATAPALAAFEQIRWICGGQAKTDNLDECAPHFGHVRKAYTIGEAGELFASTLVAAHGCGTVRNARARGGRGGCGGGARGHRPAVAGLRELRPVPRFRGPGGPVPGAGGGVMIKSISGQIKAKAALMDPSHYGRSDTSALGRWFWEIDKVLLLLITVLIAIGLIAVAAASPAAGAALFGRQRPLQRALLFLAPARVDRDRHSGDDRHFDDAARAGAAIVACSARPSSSCFWCSCRSSARSIMARGGGSSSASARSSRRSS